MILSRNVYTILLLLVQFLALSVAFSATRTSAQYMSISLDGYKMKRVASFGTLLMSENNGDEDVASRRVDEKQNPKKRQPIKVPKQILLAFDAISTTFSFLLFAVCVGLSCGLGLNLFGYGYIFEDGNLRIDTVQQFRTENQFRFEIQKSMNEQAKEYVKNLN